jgi:CDP-4-dehydro-6-deoxyglucose reductase
MIENLLESGDRREIHLFWGARTAAELYLDDLPALWSRKHAHIHYTRAVSDEMPAKDFDAFHGLVQDAVLAAHPDLSGFDVYMSGPPAMIEAAKAAFRAHGVQADRLFYDSFEFGLDVPVRVLARPH